MPTLTRILGLTALLGLAVATAAPATPDVRFQELGRRFAEEAARLDTPVPGTGLNDPRTWELLQEFEAPDGTPFACASSLTLQAIRALPELQPLQRQAAIMRLTAPPLAGARTWSTPDGAFLVRYSAAPNSPDALDLADEDSDGVPDRLELLGRAATRARDVLVDRLGWPDPLAPTGETDTFEIVLATLPGPRAYLLPSGFLGPRAGRSLLVLDPRVLDSEAETLDLVAHQLAHASQWTQSLWTEPWWYEATASWAALEASGDFSRLLPRLGERAARTHRSLRADSVAGAMSSAWFALYLAEQGGTDLIAETWRDMAGDGGGQPAGGGLTVVLDARLQGLDGRGLDRHVRAFHLWNLATGRRDTGRHYRNGSLLPTLAPETWIRRLPESGAENDRAPQGLAMNLLGFDVSDIEDGVRIGFDGEAGVPWAADVVGLLPGGGLERIPLDLGEASGEEARGMLTVPARRYDTLFLVVHNLATDPDLRGAYSWSAEAEPRYPFEIARLSAEPERGQVLLSWTSLHEQELWGWRILAADASEGPWQPVTPFLIPAIGGPDRAQDYSWLDATVLDSRRRWYKVEGVTIHGVPVESPEVSVAPLPRITSPRILDLSRRR